MLVATREKCKRCSKEHGMPNLSNTHCRHALSLSLSVYIYIYIYICDLFVYAIMHIARVLFSRAHFLDVSSFIYTSAVATVQLKETPT